VSNRSLVVYVESPPNEWWKILAEMRMNPGLYTEKEIQAMEAEVAAYNAAQASGKDGGET